jgi:hypothetical protein
MRTNIRQGLGIDQGSSSSYWTQQLINDSCLFFASHSTDLLSKVVAEHLPNQVTGSSDFLTVTGSGLNARYRTPDNNTYRTADSDYVFWKSDASESTCDGNRLIAYDFPRILVKYLNVSPYTILAIAILKPGVTITDGMRDAFNLNVFWSGTVSAHGVIKGNKPLFQKYTWVPEVVTLAETLALVARMSGTPSSALISLIDKTITDLKAGGGTPSYWDRQDVIVFTCLNVIGNSLNWKKNDFNAIPVGSPTFTAKLGIATDNTVGQYINTDFKILSDGVNYTQDDASFVIIKNVTGTVDGWFGSYEAGKGFDLVSDSNAAGTLRINNEYGDNISGRITDYVLANRRGSTTGEIVKDGVKTLGEVINVSKALTDKDFWIGSINGLTGSVGGRFSFYSFGKSFKVIGITDITDFTGYLAIIKYFLNNVGGTF